MSSARNKRLVVSALMLALALVLPYFTGGIPAIGNLLLPMHLPVLLCGFLCGGTERQQGNPREAAPEGGRHQRDGQ